MTNFAPGSLVRCREREWIVLPSEQKDLLMLRPLGGAEAEVCGIYLPLEGNSVQPASFTLPDPAEAGDFVSGQLLRDAARLSLRSGAGPFRSLGRLGIRPRPYQLVPLIMALRLDPVRLLVADDVGIGKTIEAGLIARELLDRGEIRRMTIICPPHLCDQWRRELLEKFAIDAVVVRSSTVAALERRLPRGDVSIFDYYPFTVVSVDYVKTERNAPAFLRGCPELVIVDEAHTAARGTGRGAGQQQRHALLQEIARDKTRNLVLLTATPHSGVEESFLSLLGLLDPAFETAPIGQRDDARRDELVEHLVQRRRADVRRWLGEETPFPERDARESTYMLAKSPEYRRLFEDVLGFARELVREDPVAGTARPAWRTRVRYWAALALLRCVMSSPAAAEAALRTRAGDAANTIIDLDVDSIPDDVAGETVYDLTDPADAQDLEPSRTIEEGSTTPERALVRRFATRASALRGAGDPKLMRTVGLVDELLRDGFNPIVYCRYIATANYVAEELKARIKGHGKDLRILAVTGERSEEERETLVAELEQAGRRVLVATDCLSEGINLQDAFDAVLHYDLPWNPNRLEQREGRVDRYGQRAKQVRTILLHSQDNPIDEAVMNVLLRKAVKIHRTLGITVPLPVESSTVVDTLIGSLFERSQLSLFDTDQFAGLDSNARLKEIDRIWDLAETRERESRTRFAQRAIRPDEVARELEESDAVLGDAETVRRFVLEACERLNAPLTPVGKAGPNGDGDTWRLNPAPLPQPVRERLEPLLHRARGRAADTLLLSFDALAPADAEAVGRNHPLVGALADYLLESALAPDDGLPQAARSGVVRTRAVERRTTLFLLRVRMLIESAKTDAAPLLAEELVVCGYQGRPTAPTWLSPDDALALLERAQPDANIAPDERTQQLSEAREQYALVASALEGIARERAQHLQESHGKVRRATGAGRATVRPNLPPDVLGLYVLLPVPVGR